MTSNTAFVTESGVVETNISEHYLVYSALNLKAPKPTPIQIIARNYKRYDRNRFVEDLAQVRWHEISMIDDINEMLERFNRRFLEVLNKHAPIRSMKVKYCQCPFVNQEIK